MNMLPTIEAKSDQLNAVDLIGNPRTITITDVKIQKGQDQPCTVFFEGDGGKPYKPNKSMRRVMVAVWGGDEAKYIGHSMTLFHEPTVTWAGAEIGGIRISHMTGLQQEKKVALQLNRKQRVPYSVKPLAAQERPDFTSQLEKCKMAACNGTSELRAAWEDMGQDARNGLAGELDGLKQLASQNDEPEPGQSSGPEAEQGGDYDGA